MQPVLQPRQTFRFSLRELRHRDPGPVCNDSRDGLGVHDALFIARDGLFLLFRQFRLEGSLLFLQFSCPGDIAGHDEVFLLPFQVVEFHFQVRSALRPAVIPQLHLGSRLIDQVDRLVGQPAVVQVALREVDRRRQRLIRYHNAVMMLIERPDSFQYLNGLLRRRFLDRHRLEAPLQSRVLLDIFPVFVGGRRADQLNLASRERRLQDIGGVERSLRAAGPDDRVQLVDK